MTGVLKKSVTRTTYYPLHAAVNYQDVEDSWMVDWVNAWIYRRFINLARRFDAWAQNGARETYPARRKLAFEFRRTIRELMKDDAND